MSISNQRFLVTGGTSGIGAELVRQLSAGGARVATNGRDLERLHRITESTGAIGWITDLRDPSAPTQLVDNTVAALGGLDVVIANAGVQVPQTFGYRWNDAEHTALVNEIAINLTAPIALASAAIPYLAESSGTFIGVTSGLAYAPKKSAPTYCATKSGLHTFLDSLRYQMGDAGGLVRVQEVVLPLVATPMTAGRDEGAIDPADAAEAIINGIENRSSRVLVGKSKALLVMLSVAPRLAKRLLRDH
ncbi:MAG: SDR family NAD(P)-dependent oxidoreductase [Actinomycetota bacterium]